MAISSIKPNPRVMVDTAMLLSGIVWPRWPHEVLMHAARADFHLVLSQVLMAEAREKFREKFSLHLQDFETFLEICDYELVSSPLPKEIAAHQDLMQDPDDIPIALSAINAHVDYFVSEDKHFTVRDQTTATLHQHLNIMLSGTFLRQVMGWTSEALEAIRHRTWTDMGT
jgi:predicted nucleic acid-binding protein